MVEKCILALRLVHQDIPHDVRMMYHTTQKHICRVFECSLQKLELALRVGPTAIDSHADHLQAGLMIY